MPTQVLECTLIVETIDGQTLKAALVLHCTVPLQLTIKVHTESIPFYVTACLQEHNPIISWEQGLFLFPPISANLDAGTNQLIYFVLTVHNLFPLGTCEGRMRLKGRET